MGRRGRTADPEKQLLEIREERRKRKKLGRRVESLEEVDGTIIHDNVAAEFADVPAKTSPVAGDVILAEDSENLFEKRRVALGDLPPSAAQTAQLNEAASQILGRLDEILYHLELLTEVEATRSGGDGTLLGRLDVIVQLLAIITEGGSAT